ncbi:MAG: 3-methyl-2-oxobutanoate hydroxymethyltransferase [Chloroflexi bacterium]|nr:3-methyl-2-oxobutanoate hydroxymethyltransferase [Chloroflexota bacterium]
MRTTTATIIKMKGTGEAIPMLTAYDYSTAKVLDELEIPMVLVGDSLGMVVLGYESTVYVTMDDMVHHIKAVARGAKRPLIVADMPFMSYRNGKAETLKNAARLIQEGGAQAVKLEGGESVAEVTGHIIRNGIPVMGHIGLTPQSVYQLGGYKVQGKTPEKAAQLLRDAKALEEAGVFSMVLESIPALLAKLITERVSIPTIGIGAGVHCDGQVQVIHDILGLCSDFTPKHTKIYAALGDLTASAVSRYMEEVRSGTFPTEKESFRMNPDVLSELIQYA